MICVCQFDAAGVELLDRMLEEGSLPNLARAIDRGRRLELQTPAEDYPAGSFYTLYSGVPLADHGVVYPFQWSAAEQRVRYASSFAAPPTAWERLAGTGLRTLVVDPYEARPPRAGMEPEGLVVSGWGFSERVVLPRWSHPAGASRRLERTYGRAANATEIFGEKTPEQLIGLRERLLEAPRRTARLVRDQLASQRFDLVWATFSAAHIGGHAFWDGGPIPAEHLDEPVRETLAGALEELYGEVDAAIGAVVEALPEGSELLIVSPLGMEANSSRTDMLPPMLDAVVSGRPAEPEPAGSIWSLRDRLPGSLRSRVAATIPRRAALGLTARLELRGTDWRQTKAFAHPGDNQGYVRLNLRGREREGIVEPGTEAEELLERIASGLASFRLEDGSPAVAAVRRSDELYPGARLELLPDLIVHWSRRRSVGPERLHSRRFGTVERRGAGSGRSGNHSPGGAWAVLSPGAAEHSEPSRPPRLEDVAATVLSLLGAEDRSAAGEPLLVR